MSYNDKFGDSYGDAGSQPEYGQMPDPSQMAALQVCWIEKVILF